VKATKDAIESYIQAMAQAYGRCAARYTHARHQWGAGFSAGDHCESMNLRVMLHVFPKDRELIVRWARQGVQETKLHIAGYNVEGAAV